MGQTARGACPDYRIAAVAGEVEDETLGKRKDRQVVGIGRFRCYKGGKIRAKSYFKNLLSEIVRGILRISPDLAPEVLERLWKTEGIVKIAERSTNSRI